MKRKIKIFEGEHEDSIFKIDKFSFRLVESDNSQVIVFPVKLDLREKDLVDVSFFLREINSNYEFLLDVPKNLTDYIKEYEDEGYPHDEFLFHDLRTKYIEFVKVKNENGELKIEDEIFFIGVTIKENSVYLVVKAFSLKALILFLDNLEKICKDKGIPFVTYEDVRWIELNHYEIDKNEETKEFQGKDFLQRTLIKTHFPKFLKIFKEIDRRGYFDKKFYESIMYEKRKLKNGKTVSAQIKQISKFFSPYWKFKIDTGKSEILCLHDEIPTDSKLEEYVYTFKPSLMGYYLKNWFEDFTVEIIKQSIETPYIIKNIAAGKKYNFFLDDIETNKREIDVILNIGFHGLTRLIAVECKKTLTNKEIQNTNKKIRGKIIDSGNNVFDAYLHIGCFNDDVDFDKVFEGTNLKYKQSYVASTDGLIEVPYFAFTITSKEDYEEKIKRLIKEIFDTW